MKKTFLMFMVIVFAFSLTGCSQGEEKEVEYLTCGSARVDCEYARDVLKKEKKALEESKGYIEIILCHLGARAGLESWSTCDALFDLYISE